MEITKTQANKIHRGARLGRYSYAEIGRLCVDDEKPEGRSREAVRQWINMRRSIPDEFVEIVEEITGVKIK